MSKRPLNPALPLHSPPRPDQVLGLDLAGADLAILGTLLDVLHQLLLLILQLDPFAIQFPLGSLQGSLVLAQTLRGRQPFPKGPFDDLVQSAAFE